MTIRATRDFFCGGSRVPSICKGDERYIALSDTGMFWTVTNDGAWFGMCNIDDGWEVVPAHPREKESEK